MTTPSGLIDLHMHSTYSEGSCTPAELINHAQAHGITTIALTDHNTIAGLNELHAETASAIRVITGVELYVIFQNRALHLLGYHFDLKNANLQRRLEALRRDNRGQLEKTVTALRRQGYACDINNLAALPSHQYGVVHILHELEQYPENISKINAALSSTTSDYFAKIQFLFGAAAPAHFPVTSLPAEEAIQLIHDAGGFTSLAHPGQQLALTDDQLISDLQHTGLDGIEVLTPYHTWRQIQHYQSLAQQLQLLITGGSDFHGTLSTVTTDPISEARDYFSVPEHIYTNLIKRLPSLPR